MSRYEGKEGKGVSVSGSTEMKYKDFSGADQKVLERMPWQKGSQPVSPVLLLQEDRQTIPPVSLVEAACLIMLLTSRD